MKQKMQSHSQDLQLWYFNCLSWPDVCDCKGVLRRTLWLPLHCRIQCMSHWHCFISLIIVLIAAAILILDLSVWAGKSWEKLSEAYFQNDMFGLCHKTERKQIIIIDEIISKESTTLDQLKAFRFSDIQNLNEKICGKPGNLPCVVADCGGALCRDNEGNKRCGGTNCNGALPFSKNAVGKAGQTAMLLNNLTNQLQGSENQFESIRKMTEDTKKKNSQITGGLQKSKDQIEREGEDARQLIKRVKNFLLEESAAPEDIEKVANYVLSINLLGTPQELTNVINKLKNFMTHGVDSATYMNKLTQQMEEAQQLLVKAEETEKLSKRLLMPDELINNLKKVESIQGQTRNDIATLNERIEETKAKISEAGDQMNTTNTELQDFLEKQSELKKKINSLKTKMQININQATDVKLEAQRAQNQAMANNKVLANLKKEYTNLQEKLKAKGLPLETIEKLKQLKKEAEKLTKESEEKIKRIAELEKKIQHLNQIKQNKADQLKQLENQVIAIKNEITQQSKRYASCKS